MRLASREEDIDSSLDMMDLELPEREPNVLRLPDLGVVAWSLPDLRTILLELPPDLPSTRRANC